MNKSTKAISLVLMGSALALAGCSNWSDDDDDKDRAQGHGGGYGGARIVSPGFRGGGGTAVSTGASARGGFGGIGGFGSGS